MLIQEILDAAKRHHFPLYSLSVWENGAIQTVTPMESNFANAVYSVSKNFSATAVGILVTKGVLKVTDTVWDIMHEQYPYIPEDWKHVTVGHVLSQTTGLGRGMIDIDGDRCDLYPTNDYLKMVLTEPMTYRPGEVFNYSDSHFYLACRIAHAASGINACQILSDDLFVPLAFQGHAIATCPHGHPIGGSGMFFRSVDMLKLGLLYRQGGVWNDKRILSEGWCREATSPKVPNGNYGYSFWLRPGKSQFIGNGLFGQHIYVSRENELAAAWTCHDEKNDGVAEMVAVIEGKEP